MTDRGTPVALKRQAVDTQRGAATRQCGSTIDRAIDELRRRSRARPHGLRVTPRAIRGGRLTVNR